MTINDQIRDKKLRYDNNREAAKISALSSGKIHKYEYVTGFSFRKSFEKQIEIFNELVDERHEKITNLDKKVNSDDLIYRCKGNTSDAKFDKSEKALIIINKIQNGEISLADVKNNQENFKTYLGEIKKETKNIDQKSKKALCTTLKCFTKQETKLLNFIMIIL